MGRRRGGGAAVSLQAYAAEQALRTDVASATAGKTNLTDAQVVNRLFSVFPQRYYRHNLKSLILRVSKITPLRCRRANAVDEPAPVASKRAKVDEARSASRQIEVPSSAVSASSSKEEGSSDSNGKEVERSRSDEGSHGSSASSSEEGGSLDSNGKEVEQPGSDECSHGSGEAKENGDGESERRDANGTNGFIYTDLEESDEIRDGMRETNKDGDGCRKDTPAAGDVSGNNRPMFKDSWATLTLREELRREVIVPLQQLKLLHHLGVEPTSRILLHGPPGCGKTTLARAIANEAGVPLHEISASALVSGASGAAEEKIRELFSTAYMRSPSIVLIDEIDAMTSKTESLQKETNQCLVNQLITCMDEQCRLNNPVDHDAGSGSAKRIPGYVLVIGATNRPDALDHALMQLFDREIVLDAPDIFKRCFILRVLVRNLKVEDCFNHMTMAGCTSGFVGRDLVELVKKAGLHAVNRIVNMRNYELPIEQKLAVEFEDYCKQPISDEEMENLCLTTEDFVEAAKTIMPSSTIEGFSTTPNAKWDDVGGLLLLKLEFERHIVNPIKFPDAYKDLAVNMATSFFLYGPSGCGKTLIVEALANEAGANLLHIEAPELSKYGGGSELMVRVIFNYARTHLPCVVFFDELDVMTPFNEDERRWPDFRQLLHEVGNAPHTKGVYVIGATNRREIVNHFPLIRTLFDKIMYVPPPSPEERGMVLKALARNKPIDTDVDLMALGKDAACEKFNGANLSALMKEATKAAIDRPRLFEGGCSSPWTIKDEDFKSALKKMSRSLSNKKVKN